MRKLTGTAASAGAAVGDIYRYQPFVPIIPDEELLPGGQAEARENLSQARSTAARELAGLIAAFQVADAPEGAIFQAHLEVLEDEDIWEEVLEEVSGGTNPALAVYRVFQQYIDLMEANADGLMRERAADLQDVRSRLLRCLSGAPEKNLSRLPGPVIIAARDLLPADTATMDRENVLAIITETGGQTSHSAILARSYGIPAVLGVSGAMEVLRDGETAAVDGSAGVVIVEPDGETRAALETRRAGDLARRALDAQYHREPCATADGTAIDIGVNIGEAVEDYAALAEGADLAGLFRTEFLYMQGSRLPTEEEQFAAYSSLLRGFGGKPVVLRTLDVGGDKALPCLPLPQEENPFLGKRALRLCLDRQDLFVTQLRAALRASVWGNLWIMFPMVGTPEDWRQAKALADRVRAELLAEGTAVAENVKFGVMIEVPSIVVLADKIVREVDFASIGTNDLCQYTLAVDRGNREVTGYYQMYSPAVFRMIAHVSGVFREAGKPLCVCGELGGDPGAALALVGMGLRKLSMSRGAVGTVKRVLAGKTMGQLESLAARVLDCATAAEAEACLQSML